MICSHMLEIIYGVYEAMYLMLYLNVMQPYIGGYIWSLCGHILEVMLPYINDYIWSLCAQVLEVIC